MSNDIRVWGEAAGFSLVFAYIGDDKWSCSVPTTAKDGVYPCIIKAQDKYGRVGSWVGWLYLCNGVCHLDFDMQKINFFNNSIYRENSTMEIKKDEYSFTFVKCLDK